MENKPFNGTISGSEHIPVSKDSQIIGSSKDKFNSPTINPSEKWEPVVKPSGLNIGWEESGKFELSIEPWLIAPVITNFTNGLYRGTIFGEKFNTKDSEVELGVSAKTQIPVEVVALIKGGKLYAFKTAQLLPKIGSKTFSDDLNRKYKVERVGERFGLVDVESGISEPDLYDTYTEAREAEDAKNLSDTELEGYKSGPSIGMDILSTGPTDEKGSLVGTLMVSLLVTHLYHLTTTDDVEHRATEDYYTKMREKVDKLAECIISTDPDINIKNTIPIGPTLEDYIEGLSNHFTEINRDNYSDDILSLIDDCQTEVRSLEYKLNRLRDGKKVFSLFGISLKPSVRVNKDDINGIADSTSKGIFNFIKSNKKSPVKGLKDNASEFEVKKYVHNRLLHGKDIKNLLDELFDSLYNQGVKKIKFNK